jgi:hypothetical protein
MRDDKNDDDIEDIIQQLASLYLHQGALIARLQRLRRNEAEDTPTPETATSGAPRHRNAASSTHGNDAAEAPTRTFRVGDRVVVRNPRVLQADRGTITRVGRTRITLRARDGTTVVRAPWNLELEEEHHE